MMQYTFRLFGPRKGKTMTINGHPFVDGIYHVVVGVDAASSLMRVLGYYGAFAQGTPEYAEAEAKEEAEERANGASEDHEKAEQGETVSVRSDVQPNGGGPSSQGADDGSESVSSENGGAGSNSPGNGHGHTGFPKFEEAANRPQPTEPASLGSEAIKAALLKLDPENDSYWVRTGSQAGKPKLAAVEEAYGQAGLTREDLEAALPGWNRDKAINNALGE